MGNAEKRFNFQQIHIFSLLLKYSCGKSATLNSWICEHLSGERKRMQSIEFDDVESAVLSNFCSVFDLEM